MSAQRKPDPWAEKRKFVERAKPVAHSANESHFADLSELGDIADYGKPQSNVNLTALLAAVVGLLASAAVICGCVYGLVLALLTVWPTQLAMFRENTTLMVLVVVAISALAVYACWLRGRAIRKGGK